MIQQWKKMVSLFTYLNLALIRNLFLISIIKKKKNCFEFFYFTGLTFREKIIDFSNGTKQGWIHHSSLHVISMIFQKFWPFVILLIFFLNLSFQFYLEW